MERRGHAKWDDPLRTDVLQVVPRSSELDARSRDDDLAGGVVVRHDDVRADERARNDIGVKTDDRGHRAGRIGTLHELAPRADQAHRIRETERAGGDERAEFAERVTEDDDGLGKRRAGYLLRRAKCGDRRRDQCRLGVRGLIERVLRTVEAERSQVHADRVVRLFEYAGRAWIAPGEIFPHADQLRTLSGKEPRDPCAAHAGAESTYRASVRRDRL